MAAMSLSCRCVAKLRMRLACGLSDFFAGGLDGAVASSLLLTWSTSCNYHVIFVSNNYTQHPYMCILIGGLVGM